MISQNTFRESIYADATLYVPKGTKAKYEALDGWKNFKNIKEGQARKCGDNLAWEYLYDTKTLTITGTGGMSSYCSMYDWADFAKEMETANIESGVLAIGAYSFRDCTNLKTVNMPEGLIFIDWDAFDNCISLTSISIPSSIEYLNSGAFKRCSGLTEVYSYIKEPFVIPDNVFDVATCQNATLYVPKGAKEKYEALGGWKNFKNIVEMETGIDAVTAGSPADVKGFYDLGGRKVLKPGKGLYILNGKKVIR